MSGPVSPHTVLTLLTLSYLVGEMGHFMLGATSRDMARDIGFGDKECVPRGDLENNVTSEVTQCMTRSREDCDNTGVCQWDYTGRGLDYQVDICYCPQGHLERISELFLAPFNCHCLLLLLKIKNSSRNRNFNSVL